MRLLVLSQLRFLRFAPWSALTVLFGVILAISSIVAVHQISQRVVVSLDGLVPGYLRSVTHLLDREGADMDDYFQLRERWRAGELPALEALMPIVEGSVDSEDGSLRVIGLDGFSGMPEILGLALLPPGSVMFTADEGQADVGQAVTDAPEFLRLDGVSYRIAFRHPTVPTATVLTDIGTAQVMLGLSDSALSHIAVRVDDVGTRLMVAAARLMPGFSAGVAIPEWSLQGWQVRGLGAELPSLAFSRSVLFNLGALGSLALVVAWLLVYQVGVIWLRRRQLTLDRLRQMGVSELELRSGFLISLVLLGLLAAFVGIVVGELLARLLTGMVTGFDGSEGVAGLVDAGMDGWLLFKALGSALLVCLVGGWVAYEREARPGAHAVTSSWRLPSLIGLVILTGLGGLFVTDTLLGGFVAIAAAALVVLLGIGPLLTALKGFSRRLGGRLLGRLGFRELVWFPRDLAVAVGALVLALATSVAVSLMVDSFRLDFETMLERRMVHDLFVEGSDEDLGPLADQLQNLETVSEVQVYGGRAVRVAGHPASLGFSRFHPREAARYGLARALQTDEVIISERLARLLELEPGSPLLLEGVTLTVAAVFAGFGDPVPRLLVGAQTYRRLGHEPRADRLSISTQEPLAVARHVQLRHPGLTVQEQQSLRQLALDIFDRTFAITGALTLLALLVASVGLYNALLALRLQQQPARLLLRAMGVSDREQNVIDRWRVAAVGAATVVLALPLGVLMGGLLCNVINPRAFGWSLDLTIGAGSLVWPVCSALAAMLLVSLLPVPADGADVER